MDAFAFGGYDEGNDKLRRVHEALEDIRTQQRFNTWASMFTSENVNSGYLGELADAILASE